MGNLVRVNMYQSIKDLENVAFGNHLRDLILLLNLVIHILTEIAFSAKLKNSSIELFFVIFILKNVNAPNDIGVVKFPYDVNFLLDHDGIVVSERLENLNCKYLVSLDFNAFVYIGISSESNLFTIGVPGKGLKRLEHVE